MSKRILYVDITNDGTVGGSHYCLLYLLESLDRSRYDPLVLLYQENPICERFRRAAPLVIRAFRADRNHPIPLVRKARNAVAHLRMIAGCVSFLKREKIDLLHLNNSVVNEADFWLPVSRLSGVPCITHERGFPSIGEARWSRPDRLSRSYRRVLAVSDAVRSSLLAQGMSADVVQTVHDGIDADAFERRVGRRREQVRGDLGIDADIPVVGLVGNVREWKGQEYLADALHHLQRSLPGFVCLFIGAATKDDAEFERRLRKKIEDYGLSRKVIFTGYRSDIPDLVNALDVLVNASIRPDPFPHVILEGMALGRVVVATNLGGAVESIADGVSGFLVPGDAPAILADRLHRLLSNAALRRSMEEHARRRVRELFSLQENVRKTMEIYASLLG